MSGKKGALAKDNPARIERARAIAEERLKGKTYRELCEQFGLSKSHLHQILNDDAVKDVIQTGTKEMIALVPKAVDNYKELLSSKDQKIKLQASKDCLQTTGIMPSHTPSPVVVNILNQQVVPEMSREVEGLKAFLMHQWELTVRDAVVDKKAVDEI
jgi:transcriptional regulator with XRE-family HTH domain